MTIKETYTKQMNHFCSVNCTVTAQDILALDNPPEQLISGFETRRKGYPVWKSIVACIAFFIVSGVVILVTGDQLIEASGYNSTGEILFEVEPMTEQVVEVARDRIADIFRKVHHDEKSAQIVEQGYLKEINQVMENELFSVNLVALTGDWLKPKVMFEITVKDEQLAAVNDSIYMQVYTLGVEQYENELDQYGFDEVYAKKDDDTDNRYYAVCEGAPVWLLSGEEAVIAVKSIMLDTVSEENVMHDVWFEYRVITPRNEIYPAQPVLYENVSFTFENMVYELNIIEYSYYQLQMNIQADYMEAGVPTNATEAAFVDAKLQEQWDRFVSDLILIVDGQEYKATDGGSIYIDYTGECGNKNRCYVNPVFPYIDYEAAQSIVLKVGDESRDLK